MSYIPPFDKLTRALFLQACAGTGNRTIYVAGTGSDSNTGLTTGSPFADINAALAIAQPGDLIQVDNGTYPYVNCFGINGSGEQWITIMAKAGASPLVSVADNSGDDGIDIQQSTFVGIYGLEVAGLQTSTNTNPSGICVFRSSHHIRIWGNSVHDFPGGAINCFWTAATGSPYFLAAGSWDLLDVNFNTLYNCCKYSPYNTSAISFYGAIDYTGLTWDGKYAYRAVGNYIYNCECLEPYTPGDLAYVTDGNGISIDSLYVPNNLDVGVVAYTKRGLVEGNLIVGCGGRGTHIYNSINVDENFNTYVGNVTNTTSSPALTNAADSEATFDTSPGTSGIAKVGNVICPITAVNTSDSYSTYTSNVFLGGTQTVPTGNTNRTSTGVAYFAGAPTQAQLYTALAVSVFRATLTDTGTRVAGSLGWQALGAGGRAPSTIHAGAVEQNLSAAVV